MKLPKGWTLVHSTPKELLVSVGFSWKVCTAVYTSILVVWYQTMTNLIEFKPTSPLYLKTLLYYVIPFSMALFFLSLALAGRVYWTFSDNCASMRWQYIFLSSVKEFRDGSLMIRQLEDDSLYSWELNFLRQDDRFGITLLAQGYNSRECPEEIGGFGQLISQMTGWRLRFEARR
jgi:hypothetical protein